VYSKCGRRSPVTAPAGFIASPRAAPILCTDAGPRSKPRLPAHRELDVADRTTLQLDSRPGFESVAPKAHGSGLVCGGGVCGEGGQAIRVRTRIRTRIWTDIDLHFIKPFLYL